MTIPAAPSTPRDDYPLFRNRPTRTRTCQTCGGRGSETIGYCLAPASSIEDLSGAPEGAVLASVVGASSIFEAAREAAGLARASGRPVAFHFIDRVVVVSPIDDGDEVARAWWLAFYGKTHEESLADR